MRAETVAEKPIFRDASGESMLDPSIRLLRMGEPAGRQAPYYITSPTRPILTIAGLWSEWRDRVNNETLVTCTMIITEANSFIGEIHDRMPVLHDHEGRDRDPEASA
jgi:putative SOS response-associated peptidase YedK